LNNSNRQKKVCLDHLINRTNAEPEFSIILTAIGIEIMKLGETSKAASKKIESTAGNLNKRQKVTSDTAKQLNKHALVMERHLAKLEGINDILIESNKGYIEWVTPTTTEIAENLRAFRTVFLTLRDGAHDSKLSTQSYRERQLGLKGISQELNTAINRLASVTDGIVAEIQKSEDHYGELVEIIDKKLPPEN
jgi:hypothetical protein